MRFTLANHSSYPRIGDDPEHQVLRRAIAQRDKGEITDAEVRRAEDRMAELALRDQVDAGLDVVTDGQVRWYDPVSHLAAKLGGVRINGLLRFFDTNFYFRQPVVGARLERTAPLVVDEFLFARAKSARPVKAVLTGPLTLARLSIEKDGKAGGFERLLEGYTEALAQEIAALAAAGVTLIQLDEPAILKHPQDVPRLERSLALLGTRKGAARLALAVYFGDPAPLYAKLQKLPVDILALDFTYNGAWLDMIATSGSSRTLALGLVDGRNTKLEDASAVARQVDKVCRALRPDEITLTTSCGLEYLPRDRARSKLKRLTDVKKLVLGSAA